jgi:diguanylate cyclase (GGDEF)-like protein
MTYRILLVDDDKVDRRAIQRALRSSGLDAEVCEAENAVTAERLLDQEDFDCILLDFRLPDVDGTEFLSAKLRANGKVPIPVVMLTGEGNEQIAVESMKRGAQDYLVKCELTPDILSRSVLGAIASVSQSRASDSFRDKIARMALYDPLTGLGNRNLFNERFAHSIAVARRQNFMIGLFIMDLDGFKAINDTMGHHVGDDALRQVGRRLGACARQSDTVVRLGGDEFALIMETSVTPEGAVALANKIIAIMEPKFMLADRTFSLGISIGIALSCERAKDVDECIARADMAMYQAKRSGGECAVITFDHDGRTSEILPAKLRKGA